MVVVSDVHKIVVVGGGANVLFVLKSLQRMAAECGADAVLLWQNPRRRCLVQENATAAIGGREDKFS